MKFKVSRTYTEVTPESRDFGDFSNNGFVYENESFTLKELLSELKSFTGLSCSRSCIDSGTWAETEYSTVCYKTMTERQENLHIKLVGGNQPTKNQLIRIFKIANLG